MIKTRNSLMSSLECELVHCIHSFSEILFNSIHTRITFTCNNKEKSHKTILSETKQVSKNASTYKKFKD